MNNAITTILFDLDGTLLPMDQDTFAGAYINALAMVKNDGSKTNEEAFWNTLITKYGDIVKSHYHVFDEFYQTDFQKIRDLCGFEPQVSELIKDIKQKGFRIALATNPLFPSVATESRIRWAGMQPQDFEFFTSYENSHYCKPNLDYYREVLDRLGVTAEECLMVGNDVNEDMIAEQLGMKVFLLTDCLINKENKDIMKYPNGNFDDLLKFIKALQKENIEL